MIMIDHLLQVPHYHHHPQTLNLNKLIVIQSNSTAGTEDPIAGEDKELTEATIGRELTRLLLIRILLAPIKIINIGNNNNYPTQKQTNKQTSMYSSLSSFIVHFLLSYYMSCQITSTKYLEDILCIHIYIASLITPPLLLFVSSVYYINQSINSISIQSTYLPTLLVSSQEGIQKTPPTEEKETSLACEKKC